MNLKRRKRNKLWKQPFKFYFLSISTELLYLATFATSEPVCYRRQTLDNRNTVIRQTDCNKDQICARFASRIDASTTAVLNSPCYHHGEELHTSPPEGSNQAITCTTVNLPTVANGSFDCTPNSDVSKGDACNLTCNDGFYPASSDQALCEEGTAYQGGVWSKGNFSCGECDQWNEWEGSDYKVITTTNTWEESHQLCRDESGDLVTIENEEENNFVFNVMLHCLQNYLRTWIGLNDRDIEGVWQWSDRNDATYRNWAEGEPNGGEDDNCVGLDKVDMKWKDSPCYFIRTTVCERNRSDN